MREKTDEERAAVADWLSLEATPEGGWNGRFAGYVRVHSEPGPNAEILCRAEFPRTLGLGLEIRVRSPEGEPVSEGNVDLGHTWARRTLSVTAVDPDHARRVLAPFGETLVAIAASHQNLQVTDRTVQVRLPAGAQADEVREHLYTLGHLAAEVDQARAAHPAAWQRQMSHAWPTIAAAWGLALDLSGARMHGRVGATPLSVWVEPDVEPATCVQVGLSSPLECTISVSRRGDTARAAQFVVGEPLETGDPDLDAFRLVAEPEERARRLLGPENRARLVRLLERASAVSLGRDSVELWSPGAVLHGGGIEAMMKDALAAAEWFRHLPDDDPRGEGPYRSR